MAKKYDMKALKKLVNEFKAANEEYHQLLDEWASDPNATDVCLSSIVAAADTGSSTKLVACLSG